MTASGERYSMIEAQTPILPRMFSSCWSTTCGHDASTTTTTEPGGRVGGGGSLGGEGSLGGDGGDDGCVICMARTMWRPTRVTRCGHTFCFGCISREVDMRGCCPLDRLPVRRRMLVAVQ
mmetsp:Transcript_17254/g.45598  ORF Transcript_17254/g.45598 Transcript_17254/m.45598 type:complete len:120 (+) Transcript_17254:1111-1470(+)